MTTGLLLLTTDGDAVHRLTHPRYRIPRRYTALVHGKPTARGGAAGQAAAWWWRGGRRDHHATRVRPGTDGRSIMDVTLAEGRKHIVRKWVDAMGLKMERLARLSYGPIRLGELPAGRVAAAHADEEKAIYKAIK